MRPSLNDTMMAIAQVLAARATCVKRQVGCVLTDAAGRILATGYNGVPRGFPHCTEHPCGGASNNAGSDTCMAVHAEINALLQCREPQSIKVCYTTLLPCTPCMKALMNTSCELLIYLERHDMANYVLEQWKSSGRSAFQLVTPKSTDEKAVAVCTRQSD